MGNKKSGITMLEAGEEMRKQGGIYVQVHRLGEMTPLAVYRVSQTPRGEEIPFDENTISKQLIVIQWLNKGVTVEPPSDFCGAEDLYEGGHCYRTKRKKINYFQGTKEVEGIRLIPGLEISLYDGIKELTS